MEEDLLSFEENVETITATACAASAPSGATTQPPNLIDDWICEDEAITIENTQLQCALSATKPYQTNPAERPPNTRDETATRDAIVAPEKSPVSETQNPRRHRLQAPSEPLQKHWARAKTSYRGAPMKKRYTVNFIVSHEPELASLVIEAIHKELEYGNRPGVSVEMVGTPPYLRIIAPSFKLASECHYEAQILSDELISDKTVTTSAVFVEPLAMPEAEVKLDETENGIRPRLVTKRKEVNAKEEYVQEQKEYMDTFCDKLSVALLKVGRMNSDSTLKVHFGRFYLQSAPLKKPASGAVQLHSLGRLEAIIKNHRTTGRLNTQFGDLSEASRVLKAIKADRTPFSPMLVTATHASQVRPEFHFEAYSSQHRFTASMLPIHENDSMVDQDFMGYGMRDFAVFKASSEVRGEVDFTTLSLGNKFDWKIATAAETPEFDRKAEGTEARIKSAKVVLPLDGSGDLAYPRVTLTAPWGEDFKKVAVLSVFRFRFEKTAYILEFTIRRQWKSLSDMSMNPNKPLVSFSITLMGDDWSDRARATDNARLVRGWGENLENLLKDETERRSAKDRVRAFVATLHKIRNILESA